MLVFCLYIYIYITYNLTILHRVPARLQPFLLARERKAQTATRRSRWTVRELATVDFMLSQGVGSRVLDVRQFFARNKDMHINKSESAIALKMKDFM